MTILSRFRAIFMRTERRTHNCQVPFERREQTGTKGADDRARKAIDDFEQTVRMKREDFIKKFGCVELPK